MSKMNVEIATGIRLARCIADTLDFEKLAHVTSLGDAAPLLPTTQVLSRVALAAAVAYARVKRSGRDVASDASLLADMQDTLEHWNQNAKLEVLSHE
jgi:hypothetical protein